MSENQECLSDFAIDRYLAGEHEEPAAVERRVQSCEHCRVRLETLRLDAEQARAALPGLPSPREGRGGWVALVAVAAGLLLALSLAWALVPTDEGTASSGSARIARTRTKGRARMTAYVRRGERVFTLGNEALQEGDALAFAYTTAQESHLAVFDIDGGRVALLHPRGASTLSVKAGVDVELDLAVELDGSLSEERIVAVFCSGPTATGELAASLEAATALPDGCFSDSIELRKVGAP